MKPWTKRSILNMYLGWCENSKTFGSKVRISEPWPKFTGSYKDSTPLLFEFQVTRNKWFSRSIVKRNCRWIWSCTFLLFLSECVLSATHVFSTTTTIRIHQMLIFTLSYFSAILQVSRISWNFSHLTEESFQLLDSNFYCSNLWVGDIMANWISS